MQPPRLGIDLEDELAVLEVEEALAALDDVEAVRLVPGDRRPVDELHVVVTPARDPKQTVRDVQSLLVARYGIDVDRRVISVVQLPSDTGQRLRDGIPRLVLDSVQIEVRGGETSVTVQLLDGEELVRGVVGPVEATGVVAATAEATLDAIADLRLDMRLRLAGAHIADVGPERVAIALVDATAGRARDLLTGSAVVRAYEADAIARAVLDATNRLRKE